MNLSSYLDISGRWLVEVATIYDLAEATSRAMNPSYTFPVNSTWADGPHLSSGRDNSELQKSIPLVIRSSLEAAKAAELIMGRDYRPNESGKTRIPMVSNEIRTGQIIARMGIVSQFELWKNFVARLSYPINAKQAESYTFRDLEESAAQRQIVRRRNELTHEIKASNDPTMRELIEFAYLCHFLARRAARA
jgi:hypothetical protein